MDYAFLGGHDGHQVVRCKFEDFLANASEIFGKGAIDKRRVGLHRIKPYEVSTVFLAMDHGFGGTPMWFETMVFRLDADGNVSTWNEELCWRYETWNEAETGHNHIVAELMRGVPLAEIEMMSAPLGA